MADLLERANRWLSRRQQRALNGCRDEVSALREDRHTLTVRLELLAKVSALVGRDLEELLPKIAELSIPELADWSSVDVLGESGIRRIHVAQRDPGKQALADELLRLRPWPSRVAWPELMAGRTLFFPILSDEVLEANLDSPEHVDLAKRIGVRSGITVPLRERDATVAVMTFITTAESERHYDYYDVVIAEELARRAAALLEHARLLGELKASDARFRIALAMARTAVFEQDRQLRYRWAYYDQLGMSVVGKRHEDLFPRPLADQLTALKQHVLETGEPFRGERAVTIDGKVIAIRAAIDPVRDESGAVVGILGASTDISDEKRVREQLAQAVDFSDRMVAILGHDLRNPLGAILASAGLLRQKVRRRSSSLVRSIDVVERIERAARRMSEMIATLLDFTQLRGNRRLPVSLAPTDLAEVSRAVVDELRSAHPDRTIALEVHGDAHGLWDAARMGQVISNLVGNALTHGEGETPISVAIDADGDGDALTLRVHNYGPAIAPELVPQLFEPFRRGLDMPAGTRRGLGLGLFIVKQIVLAHAGDVHVESTPGAGTSFIVRLPRRAADPSHRAPPSPAPFA
jgi:signal transduction histidine kinase